MVEWRERFADCYGDTSLGGYAGVEEMDRNYRRITDERILFVARKYGTAYAVLYKETLTGFPMVFEEGPYKVIRIDPGAR